jgi:hypothetical protein
VPKPSITAALVVAAVLVAAIAATFALVAVSSEPKALEPPASDEVVVIYPDRDPDESIACMFELDCLMRQIEAATAVPPAPGPPPAEVVPAVAPEA